MNPFLTTKKNNYPTYMIVPQPRRKVISILPIEDTSDAEKVLTEEIAKSAMKLETARKISVSGDASGAAIFDGTADAEIKITVKNAERAIKDGTGKEISKTYAAKSELADYAKKSEIAEKLNYIERILYETKNAVNEMQNELNAAKEKIVEVETNAEKVSEIVNDLAGETSGTGTSLADDEDIEKLFEEW